MLKRGIRGLAHLMMVLGLVAFLGAGCTKYASQEDLKTLEEQKRAALSAEKKVEELRAEKKKLESQKADKEDELKKAQKEKELVTKRVEARQAQGGE